MVRPSPVPGTLRLLPSRLVRQQVVPAHTLGLQVPKEGLTGQGTTTQTPRLDSSRRWEDPITDNSGVQTGSKVKHGDSRWSPAYFGSDNGLGWDGVWFLGRFPFISITHKSSFLGPDPNTQGTLPSPSPTPTNEYTRGRVSRVTRVDLPPRLGL